MADIGKMAERQILKAEAEGQFDNLAGAGKPLPPNGPEDAAEAAGMRIMAEAGALPREIELRKAVKAQAEYLATLTNPDERKVAMSELAKLQMRLAIEEEARKKFYSTR